MVKVGIIGLGTMGRQHMEAYRQMPDVEVAAVYDRREERTASFAQEYGVFAASDFDTLLSRCDIIDICTPTYRHAEYALPAIEAGKAVVCEKPLARTLEECERIVEAVKNHNTPFMPAHVLRFFPEYRTAHQLIRNGILGAVAAVRMRRGGDFPRTKSDWYADFEKSGGVILDLIIHDFDWMLWTLGAVERVYAKSLTFRNLQHLDYTLVTLKFKNGAVGQRGRRLVRPWRLQGELRGVWRYGNAGVRLHAPSRPAGRDPRGGRRRRWRAGSRKPRRPQPVLSGTAPLRGVRAGGADARNHRRRRLHAVRLALAAIESAQTGRVITL